MSLWLKTVFVVSIALPCVLSLDPQWMKRILNSNCNTTILSTIERNSTDMMPLSPSTDCPSWYYRSENGNDCVAGKSVDSTVIINRRTMQASVKHFFCMTKRNDSNVTVVGKCAYSVFHLSWAAIPLPCNASQLEEYMCAGLNREGQLCGRCKKDYAPAVYSYCLQCVHCTAHFYLNWLKYGVIAFVPLTLFFIVVVLCHISPTSPYLHGFIFFSQILSLPQFMRLACITSQSWSRTPLFFYLSLLNIWNLDFFRMFYRPFCINPSMTIVQSLALDYLIAFYPLILLFTVYSAIKLYSRNFILIVNFWKFIRPIVMLFKDSLNIKTSLVQSFATIVFLSSMKLQTVSFDLLTPTFIYYNHGSSNDKLFLFLAGNTEFFGAEHLLYGIFAVFVLAIFVLLPALLLLLYPCTCCQRVLNKLHCNSLVLRTFMDAYHGMYKDGTNDTRDYRFFSGIFFISRTVMIVLLVSFSPTFARYLIGYIAIGISVSIAIFHPQKSQFCYTLDFLFSSSLSVLALMALPLPNYDNHINNAIEILIGSLAILFPLFYMFYLVFMLLVWKAKLPQRLLQWIQGKHKNIQQCSGYSFLT